MSHDLMCSGITDLCQVRLKHIHPAGHMLLLILQDASIVLQMQQFLICRDRNVHSMGWGSMRQVSACRCTSCLVVRRPVKRPWGHFCLEWSIPWVRSHRVGDLGGKGVVQRWQDRLDRRREGMMSSKQGLLYRGGLVVVEGVMSR